MNSVSPLVLVDGSSYLYRAYHALPPLTTSKGQPTGAVKGVINMIRRLQKDYPASHLVIIFDAKGKTFRDAIYSDYKANRPPMPDDLSIQIEPINQIIAAMGLPLLAVEGVEADDVIGTLATQAGDQRMPVVVSTGDKDLAQLVNESVTLVNTMTETQMDPAGVVDKFSIPPERIVDYLALVGDKVDNIPGVAGVGEKTALALIQGLGGLNEIYSAIEKVAELDVRGAKKLGEKLLANETQARLSYQLATIKCDVELPCSATKLASGELHSDPDREKLLELFKELEFKSWVEELHKGSDFTTSGKTNAPASADGNEANPSVESATYALGSKIGDYETVLNQVQFAEWIKKLENAKVFAFDTETTSLDYSQARVVGVSFAIECGHAAYVPFGHDYPDCPAQLSEEQVLGALKPLLESSEIKKIGQNLKYDKHVIANHGIDLNGIADDTMLMSYVLNASTRHDMDSLALSHLDYSTTHFEDIAGKGAKQLSFNQIDLDIAAPYAAEDADITLRLHAQLGQKLAQQPLLKKLYDEIELPLLNVICQIEANGALIDSALLAKQSEQLGKRMVELEAQAYELAGETFNLASPKQLQAILFDKLQLPVLKKTPKGQPSTAEPVLQELALDYPLPKLIMEYRGLSKLKSTYTDRLPEQIVGKTGRVHTSYHQAVTATGRLSSTDPNLQNIPIRTEEGRRVRKAFIADKGYCILAADYSQIELRIMAHLSQDGGLSNAFKQGHDVHKATAAEVFNVGLEEVSADQRRKAKAINFGLIYGMSAFGLGRQLGIGRNQAQEYIDRYFERYPGVLRYMENTRVQAAEDGYVETLFGRRLYLPEINARNGMRRQAAERTAINAPMQGTAADIIKIAMLKIDQWIASQQHDIKMIMQVHDELVFELPRDCVEQARPIICDLMAGAAELSVPLIVDAGVGFNWEEAH